MTQRPFDIIKLLIASQVAVLEYTEEAIGTTGAKAALVQRLTEALKMAKKLED